MARATTSTISPPTGGRLISTALRRKPGCTTGVASFTNLEVTDDLGLAINCPAGKNTLQKPADSNDAKDTDHEMTCTATYAVTDKGIDAGPVTVAATVDRTTPTSSPEVPPPPSGRADPTHLKGQAPRATTTEW